MELNEDWIRNAIGVAPTVVGIIGVVAIIWRHRARAAKQTAPELRLHSFREVDADNPDTDAPPTLGQTRNGTLDASREDRDAHPKLQDPGSMPHSILKGAGPQGSLSEKKRRAG